LGFPVEFVEPLIRQIAEPGHERVAHQKGGPKDVFSEPVSVRVVLPQAQDRVVFEQAIQDIKRLARRARNDTRAENRILVRGMSVYADRAIIVAEVARVKRRQ